MIKIRFWSKVRKTSGCWNWTGAKCSGRYGNFGIGNRTSVLAHRYSWELHFGRIPSGLNVLHRCDNGLCVNPSHLFIGTQADNVLDMHQKGRDRKAKGSGVSLSKLTEREVVEIKRLLAARAMIDREIADRFNVARVTVNHIRTGRTWRHVQI